MSGNLSITILNAVICRELVEDDRMQLFVNTMLTVQGKSQ